MSRNCASKMTTLVQATAADEVDVDEEVDEVVEDDEDEDDELRTGHAAFCRRPMFHGR